MMNPKNLLTTLAATCIILSKSEQSARVTTYQDDDASDNDRAQALTDLVSTNVRLAHKVAKQHVRNGLDFNDLLAQACEGIVHAASKYEVGNKASFTTYAKQWMRARCQKSLWSSLQKAQKALGADATPEAIAVHLKLDVDDVRACLATMSSRGISINKPVGDEKGATLGSIIPDGGMRQDVRMERTQNSESIADALETFAATLKPGHVEILRGRVIAGLTGEDQRCAKTFGVSKQRVGQIEKQLRVKLAAHFTSAIGADGVKNMLRASF